MNFKRVEEIAEAVLYEGYMLYPYRQSSVKNQQRFNFGVLCPPACRERDSGFGSNSLQIECLIHGTQGAQITVKIRFLHLVQRIICRYSRVGFAEYVPELRIDDRRYRAWQEAEERTVLCEGLQLAALTSPHKMEFTFPGGSTTEELRDKEGNLAGAIVRTWRTLTGSLEIEATHHDKVIKLRTRVVNHSEFSPDLMEAEGRETALLASLVSAHAILGVDGGEFYSLLDPPSDLSEIALSCENIGVWPVLAGDDAATVLASPIILYDYPQIAPESAGDLFDATEIDEILSLRILTLTDAEKAEIREGDDRARALLERTENILPEQFQKLHGVLRGVGVAPERPE